VRRAADAGRRHGDLAGIGLGIGDELGERLGREGGRHLHHERLGVDGGNGRDIAQEVVIELLIKRGVNGIRRGDDEERVAIGGGVGDIGGRQIAARAGAIFHHDRLTELLRQRLREDAGDDVGPAAGRKADDDVDGPRRIGVGEGGLDQRGKRRSGQGPLQKNSSRQSLPRQRHCFHPLDRFWICPGGRPTDKTLAERCRCWNVRKRRAPCINSAARL
jgi:hypothetical protein